MGDQSHAKRVAANVRAEMARSQRTQAALAHEIGMKQQALSRRLSAQTSFSIDELGQIAAVLGVPLADLVGEAVA
jgi:transcriptional regulator with XRE-family HTH domain